MVKKCCIRFCKSESYGGCGISFHSFPKNEEIKQLWKDVVPVSQNLTKNSVVCSLHFKLEDFYTANSRRLLKTEAIPSVFPLPETEPSASTSQSHYTSKENIESSTKELDREEDSSSNESEHIVPKAEIKIEAESTTVQNYYCNECHRKIVGFRYVCVQCVEYELCGACEAGGAHAEHYVLRVPGLRPHWEVSRVLEAVRRELNAGQETEVTASAQDTTEQPIESETIKIEIKSEPEFEPDTLEERAMAVDIETATLTPVETSTPRPGTSRAALHSTKHIHTTSTGGGRQLERHVAKPRADCSAPASRRGIKREHAEPSPTHSPVTEPSASTSQSHYTSKENIESSTKELEREEDSSSNESEHIVPKAEIKIEAESTTVQNYYCNECHRKIVGFRYVCVQCVEYELCGACEAGGAHAEHYVLRVPGLRPHWEVSRVLEAVRRELNAGQETEVTASAQDTTEQPIESETIKIEIKSEPEFEPDTLEERAMAVDIETATLTPVETSTPRPGTSRAALHSTKHIHTTSTGGGRQLERHVAKPRADCSAPASRRGIKREHAEPSPTHSEGSESTDTNGSRSVFFEVFLHNTQRHVKRTTTGSTVKKKKNN